MLPAMDADTSLLNLMPSELTNGYRGLVAMERRFAIHAVHEHRSQVEAWHRLLTLLAGPFAGGTRLAVAEEPAAADRLRFQLIAGIGAGTSKLSLDAAMAGYYSQSFALTRHMLESWAQAAYVRIRPEEAYRWYAQPGDPKQWDRPRSFDAVRKAIRPHIKPKGIVDRVDAVIKQLNKGAHPSPELLAQTVGVRLGQYVVGPSYERDLAAESFYFGVYATYLLLAEFMAYVEDMEAWAHELSVASRDLQAWLHVYLGDDLQGNDRS